MSDPVAGRALHLLLRMSDVDAVPRHLAVAQTAGAVWWPRYGARRHRPTRRELVLQRQLAEGVETWVYLLDGRTAHSARLEAISFDSEGVDPGRVTAGFDRARPVTGLLLLRSFNETTRRALVDGLVLDSAPVPGGLQKSLRGSQATLYVRRLGAVEPAPAAGAGKAAAGAGKVAAGAGKVAAGAGKVAAAAAPA